MYLASKSCLNDTRYLVHAASNSYLGTVPKHLGTVPSGAGGNYLHHSDTPTTALQETLPRLPIPNLADTCARYLNAQRPLLTDAEFAATSDTVNKFRKGVGRDLHAALLAREKTLHPQHSYIHHAWLDMYQCDRGSVLLNSNPVLTYSDHPDPALNTQIDKATQLVTSTLRYFCTLRDNKLPPINACMMQFPLLFQSTRIPGKTRDENVRFPDSRHLAVLHKGHVYSIDVLDSRGEIRDTVALQLALEEIIADSRAPNKQGLGYFTALEREEWSNVRAELEAQNKPFLDAIDEAIFVLCLDDLKTQNSGEVLKNGLVGEGHNRWFDKSFSLVVTQDGKAGVNWEHSWGDGVTIMHMINNVHTDYLRQVPVKSAGSEAIPVVRVDPVYSDSILGQLEKAKSQYEASNSGSKVVDFNFGGFGKSAIKKFGMSPDSVSQLIFQMGYWRTHGECVGTYESGSTAHYRSGRTETIRSCSTETKNCSVAFDYDHQASLSEIVDLLKKTSSKHVSLCKEAAQGEGFDRHLFALRTLNRHQGEKELELFTDPSWGKMANIGLSTSTVGSPALQLYLAFGAVSPQGYGLGYLMSKESFGAAVSCYLPNDHFSDFVDNLGKSAEDLLAVFQGKNIKLSRTV
ncbi:carnitine O-palmitoyltransferase 2, mitochondrial-like isoform X2 [Bolinopsis microptera]|uniref:carnitine O-palmitoyltransferase 2, mitochondrial-like isoform X2 n=1 Tax=Bolinopsis microptera TaxID=2820187 RepID=UPI0030795192